MGVALGLSVLACGGSDGDEAGQVAADANPTAADGGTDRGGGAGGMQQDVQGDDASASAPVGDDATPMQACRHYFETICARIRECDAPMYRACVSPADLCPDALFAADGSWTIEEVLACADTWTTHACDELDVDRWPACSQRTGSRDDGVSCVFDAQCKSGVCVGGVFASFDTDCGQCATAAAAGDACGEGIRCAMGLRCDGALCVEITPPEPPTGPLCGNEHCEDGYRCENETCVPVPLSLGDRCFVAVPCEEGLMCAPTGQAESQGGICRPPPQPVGAACSSVVRCEEGLVCAIELPPEGEPEPDEGICAPPAALGEPCVPTFGANGICEEGVTCDGRPTGDCVPLREIGEYCGYATCVEGAYCAIYSAIEDVQSHTCHPLRAEGDPCFGTDEVCAEGLLCPCPSATCEESVCTPPPEPPPPDDNTGEEIGDHCERHLFYGRLKETCVSDDDSIECLCTTPDCTEARCAEPRIEGESCDGQTQLCRQGFACEASVCAALETLDVEAISCSG